MSAPLSPEERALLGAVPDDGGPPVDDALLVAFRAGKVPPEARESVAAAIAADPESRALLRALAAAPAQAEDRAWMAGMRATRGPRTRRRAVWIGGAVALAAVVAALTMRADLRPEYALEGPFGGIVDARGDTDIDATEERPPQASHVFAPTSRIRLIARPLPEGAPATACAGFVQAKDGSTRRVQQSAITLAPSGVCRLKADIGALASTAGAYTVVLIVGGTPDPDASHPWPGWDAEDARILSAPFTLRTKAQP